MFFKILQVIQFICSIVREIEDQLPTGAGAEKKQAVMKSLTAELRRQGMVGSDSEPAANELLEGFSGVVDGVVKSANAAGAFHRSRAASSETEPPQSAESSSGA